MSQENVELTARFYGLATTKAEILAALPRTVDLCHPEIEWTVPHGRKRVRVVELRYQPEASGDYHL